MVLKKLGRIKHQFFNADNILAFRFTDNKICKKKNSKNNQLKQ